MEWYISSWDWVLHLF